MVREVCSHTWYRRYAVTHGTGGMHGTGDMHGTGGTGGYMVQEVCMVQVVCMVHGAEVMLEIIMAWAPECRFHPIIVGTKY